MRPRYISGSVVRVSERARSVRYSDRKRHEVTTRWITPTKPNGVDRDTLRQNTLKNDGLRAHSDVRARLYT